MNTSIDIIAFLFLLKSSSSGDDFNELPGDNSLSGSVECEGELVNHLTGVLAGIVHGSHSAGLFATRALLHRVEEQRGQRELQVALYDLFVDRVVNGQFRSCQNRALVEQWQIRDSVRHH